MITPPNRHRPGSSHSRLLAKAPSPLLAHVTPWLTILLASIVPGWLTVATAPLLPPFGYILLLSWRQLRPGLLPVWAGLPLGLVDDLFSGQPFGSAILLWSASMLLLDIIEIRFPWRSFMVDWMVAAGMIILYDLASMFIVHLAGNSIFLLAELPQMAMGVLVYPAVGRVVAWCDEIRLTRFGIW